MFDRIKILILILITFLGSISCLGSDQLLRKIDGCESCLHLFLDYWDIRDSFNTDDVDMEDVLFGKFQELDLVDVEEWANRRSKLFLIRPNIFSEDAILKTQFVYPVENHYLIIGVTFYFECSKLSKVLLWFATDDTLTSRKIIRGEYRKDA